MADANVGVHDIEFVTIDEAFDATRLAPILETASELGVRTLSVCGADRDRGRLVTSFAALCDVAASFGMGVDLECMAWRSVSSLQEAVRVVVDSRRSNAGVLVDALHLVRTGGFPSDLRGVPSRLVRSAQLCDAPAARPESMDAIIEEARSRRLPPGVGELPLCALLAELPAEAYLSVEVPMGTAAPPETRARDIFEATDRLFARCRAEQQGRA